MKKFLIICLAVCTLYTHVSAMPLFSERGNTVVITYHRLSKQPLMWNDYCISPEQFEKDILFLKSKGYEFYKASQLASKKTEGKKIAVITFDDGYDSDFLYALPILEKHGACATFFIFGEGIGKNEYMSVQQLKQLSEKDCVEIGNHSYALHSRHKSTLEIMYGSGKQDKQIIEDFEKNDAFIAEITGKSALVLSYPNGVYSETVDKYLKNNGKTVTFSTKEMKFQNIEKEKPVGRKNRGAALKKENLLK